MKYLFEDAEDLMEFLEEAINGVPASSVAGVDLKALEADGWIVISDGVVYPNEAN